MQGALAAAAAQVRAVRARLAADVAMLAEIPTPVVDLSTLTVGELAIDRSSRTVTLAGQPVKVTNREFELLALMATDPTRVFPKRELLREAWGPGYEQTDTRTLDSHACRLRTKLGGKPWLQNSWGVGYRLTPPAAALRAARFRIPR